MTTSASTQHEIVTKTTKRFSLESILTGTGILFGLMLLAIGIGLSLQSSPYALSSALFYADFRFWPDWMTSCCWIVFVWALISSTISLFVPKNEDLPFALRRSFYKKIAAVFFLFMMFAIWHKNATLPLSTVFAPILSPLTDYLYINYSLPLADYQTSGEGSNPLFWPTVSVIAIIVLFLTWRAWYYIHRWKKSKEIVASLFLCVYCATAFGANRPVTTIPPKVETSVGIYDVKSPDDLEKYSAEEVRELVRMENERVRDDAKPPHPVLVYAFEEKSFTYSGGMYDNAEIPFRLHVPKNIVPGKTYPLVVHLHGAGESGNDNMRSLAHLHSILPLLVGPEQREFFMLVAQCPYENPSWNFRAEKDGNLDVASAATDFVVQNYPIDVDRVSVSGLSSGGYGVWQWIAKEPERFAAAVPLSCTFPGNFNTLNNLQKTAIWTFVNYSDTRDGMKSLQTAKQFLEQNGGYMKITVFDLAGHSAWRPAMNEYGCMSWMIAQKRGGLFNPPPGKIIQGHKFSYSFFAFFLPLGLATGLFLFQKTALCEVLHESIADKFYNSYEYEDNGDEEESELEKNEPEKSMSKPLPPLAYRNWSNRSGTQTFSAKFVRFQDEKHVLLQINDGKTASVPIAKLGQEEQVFLQNLRNTIAERSQQ